MDDDNGKNNDLLDAPDTGDISQTLGGNDGESLTDKAAGIGQGVKDAANTAKRVIGESAGGAGDGLSSVAGAGNSIKNVLSSAGGSGGVKSIPGVGGNNTQSMFTGLEGAKPAGRNNTSADQQNPSAKDFDDKANGHASSGQRVARAASDIAQTAQEGVHAARAAAGDATAIAELTKDVARAMMHPIETAKRYGRDALYIGGFFAIQSLMVLMVAGVLFFGLYKVYLITMEGVDDPVRTATAALRMNNEMTNFLVSAVGDLAYERSVGVQKQSGVAVAQSQPNTPDPQTNPETSKMHETWANAGLAAKFLDDYNASFVPSNSSGGGNNTNPGSWDLVVSNRNFGPVNGAKAQAFISIFTENTTHWKDIYTREAMQGVASSEFQTESFKLDLPDSESNLDNSRVNTTKQLVSTTAKPVAENSVTYYKCLIAGSTNCDSLGLGSTNSGDNSSINEDGTPLEVAIANIRDEIRTIILENTAGVEQIGEYATSTAEQVTTETSSYKTRNALSASIRTGASDAILKNLPKDSDGVSPDSDALLDLYDRYRSAVENENYARVNYDRESRQSIALAENYFIAGGQFLNYEIDLLDSWAFTESLGAVGNSPLFKTAVIGNPAGVYAQDDADNGIRTCQEIFNDLDPVGDVNQNLDRATTKTSCFNRSLVPDRNTLVQDRSVNRIYSILEGKNKDANQSGSISGVGSGIGAAIGAAIDGIRQQYVDGQIRSSPLAAEGINVAKDLSPDFDGYTNGVYGVGRTGAETDGPVFDTILTASEALWTKALIDEEVGIGASFQTDEEYVKIMRYADNMEREKMAFKPLGDRLFAIKDYKSLSGKLAMMTPTTKEQGIKSTLALLKPSNLTSAVASRMTPTTLAASSTSVNPLKAVRTNYSMDDPSNTMSGAEIWDRYNCDSGGVIQVSAKPEGVPFNLPTNTNPCKREVVMAKVGTCWFDTEDSCSFGDGSTSSAPNTSGTGTVGDIGESSDDVPCAEGSNDLGNVESRYTGTLRKDNPLIIKLCQVPDVGGRGNNTSGSNVEGGIVVNSRVSGAWVALGRASKTANVELTGSSFRLADSCGGGGDGGLCARPGTSMHQLAIAVDFSDMGSSGGSTTSCSGRQGAPGDARWQWLFTNAQNFGIKQYSYEPWHWDTNPGANRCDSSSPAVN